MPPTPPVPTITPAQEAFVASAIDVHAIGRQIVSVVVLLHRLNRNASIAGLIVREIEFRYEAGSLARLFFLANRKQLVQFAHWQSSVTGYTLAKRRRMGHRNRKASLT